MALTFTATGVQCCFFHSNHTPLSLAKTMKYSDLLRSGLTHFGFQLVLVVVSNPGHSIELHSALEMYPESGSGNVDSRPDGNTSWVPYSRPAWTIDLLLFHFQLPALILAVLSDQGKQPQAPKP